MDTGVCELWDCYGFLLLRMPMRIRSNQAALIFIYIKKVINLKIIDLVKIYVNHFFRKFIDQARLQPNKSHQKHTSG